MFLALELVDEMIEAGLGRVVAWVDTDLLSVGDLMLRPRTVG